MKEPEYGESKPNSDAATTSADEIRSLPLPDVGDFLFIFVMQLLLFVVPCLLFSDGSTGWHIVAGDYMIDTASIPTVDLFSNTFPEKAWVAYEWFFDVVMSLLVELGGFKLLAVVLSAAIAFLFLAIYDRTRREGASIATSFFLVTVAVLTAATHWLARPHLVTFWCVWVFVTTLEDFYRGILGVPKLFFLLCPLMLLWVNCHPAFILALVIVSIYVVSCMVQAGFSSDQTERLKFKRKRNKLLMLVLALVAITFVNPYGIGLHKYILSYLGGHDILAATNEYMSPVFKGGLHPTCLEILFFAFASGLFVSRKRISLPGMLTCLAFGHAALTAVRNMPLYAIVATPFIGRLWAAKPDTVSEQVIAPAVAPASFPARIKKALADFEQQEAHCKMHLLPIIYTVFLIVVSANGGSFFDTPMLKSAFDPATMPVETTAYIKKNKIEMRRVFNFDNWGGYLRYTLGERVFIDDRADFYGRPFYQEYSVVMAAAEGWPKILDKYKLDYVLFPKNSALAATLRKDPAWKSVASDEASELFERVK